MSRCSDATQSSYFRPGPRVGWRVPTLQCCAPIAGSTLQRSRSQFVTHVDAPLLPSRLLRGGLHLPSPGLHAELRFERAREQVRAPPPRERFLRSLSRSLLSPARHALPPAPSFLSR